MPLRRAPATSRARVAVRTLLTRPCARAALASVAVGMAIVTVASPAHALSEFAYLAAGGPSRSTCAATAGEWQSPEFDDASWSDALATGSDASCAVLRVRRRFNVGAELPRLAVLTLNVRWRDGFVAWVNGVEVARRNVAGDGFATGTHGAEAERIYVPLGRGQLRAKGNVLALEARPARAGRTAAVDAQVAATDGLRVVRGPYLLNVLDGRAEVLVQTDLPSTAEVRWDLASAGTSARSARTARSATASTSHVVRLEGLRPGRAYRYRVLLRAATGEEASAARPLEIERAFHTPGDATRPLRFVLYGDVRSGHDVHARLVRAIEAEHPDLLISTGDLVASGHDDGEWQRYFDIEAALLASVPAYHAVGNHDYGRRGEGLQRFLSMFPRPPILEGAPSTTWWSFDVAGVHFLMLDSQAYDSPDQIAWLRADLEEALDRSPRAIFAVAHHGPYSAALHGDNRVAQQLYVPLLEAAGATLFFSGHDHDYERGQVGSLPYVVSGGGGAELRPLRCGAPGKKRCDPRTLRLVNDHHYVVVEVLRDRVRLSPRRPDGSPLEEPVLLPLRPAPPANAGEPALGAPGSSLGRGRY